MIGENIRRIRNNQKLSLNALAKKAGVSSGYLSELENNISKNPTMDKLNKIAEALGVPIDEFFKEDNDSNINSADLQLKNKLNYDLDIIPEQFTDPDQARAYVKKHRIFASEGFNADLLDDEKIVEFANAILEQAKLVSYKYKK